MRRLQSRDGFVLGRKLFLALLLVGLQIIGLNDTEQAAAQTSSKATAVSFTVTIQEQAGIPRRSEPTKVSLPFAVGVLKREADVGLFDAGGKQISAQFEVIARWNDGSIRWLLAHFLGDVPAKGTIRLTVRSDRTGSSAKGPDMVRKEGSSFVVDMGVIRARVGAAQRDGFLIIDDKGKPLLSERPQLAVYSPTGKEYRSGLSDKVHLEANGSLYASIFLAGPMKAKEAQYENILRWETRLHFWKGLGQVLAEHTLVAVGAAKDGITIIDGIVVDLKSAGRFLNYIFAGQNDKHSSSLKTDEKARLKQTCAYWHEATYLPKSQSSTPTYIALDADFGYELKFKGDDVLVQGEKSAGWLWAGGPEQSIGIAVRDFWEEGPKALSVAADGSLGVECYARWQAKPGEARPVRQPTPDYSGHPKRVEWSAIENPEERMKRWLADTGYTGPVRRGPFRFGTGRAKTTDVLYLFGRADNQQAELDVLAARRHYLIPVVDPRYLASTGAMPFVWTTAYDSGLPVFEKGLRDVFENWKEYATRYGFLHFGDDQCHFGYNHTIPATTDDQEYDTSQCLTMQFARTGNSDYLRWANICARHFIDVDQIQSTGELRYHGYTSGGDYHEESKGIDMGGHPYIGGIVNHYMLTGDRRSLRGVNRVAKALEGYGHGAQEWLMKADGRSIARPGICLAAIYDLTKNPDHLAPVKRMVDAINDLAGDVTNDLRGEAPFRMWWFTHSELSYHVRELLVRYHAATGDPRTLATLKKALDLYIHELWDSQHNWWRMSSLVAPFNFDMPYGHAVPRKCPGGPDTAYATVELGMPFAYAATVTGNTYYLTPLLDNLDNIGADFAKQFGNRAFARRQLWSLPFVSMLPADWWANRDTILQREVFRASLKKDDGLTAWTPQGQVTGKAHGEVLWRDSSLGKVLQTYHNSFVTFDAPKDFLRMPGTVSFWVRNDEVKWDRRPWPWYGALRGLLYIGSDARETNALDLMILEKSQYGATDNLWARLYDDRAWEMVAIKNESPAWGERQWHHIAVVWNRFDLTVFINGEQVGHDDRFALPNGGQTTIYLGWRPTNRYGQADYYDLRLFRSALSPERIKKIHESTHLVTHSSERLGDPWKFKWDPDNVGEGAGWAAEDIDDADWLEIGTDWAWEQQEAGKQWRRDKGVDYNGLAWYRKQFMVARDEAKPKPVMRLVFEAVDEACVVWMNGKRLLDRAYPFQGNRNSWQEAFGVDITEVVRYGEPNVVVVRVEDNIGAGGIWKPVRLVRSAASSRAP